MEFGMSRRITPNEKYVHFNLEFLSNLDFPPKNRIVELCSEF